MTTLSQMTDELAIECLRPDMKPTIAGYVNQTIRELHATPDGIAIRFTRNLIEDAIVANIDVGFQWVFPKPQLFQSVEAVYYPALNKYARLRSPSTTFAFTGEVDADLFYYRSGNYLCFSGYGGVSMEIDIAYFQYLRKLPYYASALRPCTWSDTTQTYTYLPAYDVNPTTRADALDLCTNWMLETHEDLIRQGTRAKLYARLVDMNRAKLSFSLYENLRPAMVSAETYDSVATYSR